MVKIYASRSILLNPDGEDTTITHDQLWAVLQYKVHHPEEFGNLLSKAEIVSDKDGVVVRNIVLNLPGSKTKTYQEEITSYGNSWLVSRLPDGTSNMNIISYGKDMDEDSLQLVYMLEWDVEVEEGSKEHEERKSRLNVMALVACTNVISKARELIKDGTIA